MQTTTQNTQRKAPQSLPCQVNIYDQSLGHCRDVAEMIGAARELLLSSEETADNYALLAKAYQGTRSLLLYVDRDNYEFVMKFPGGQKRVAGGNLANELKHLSSHGLRQMMSRYLESGAPIKINKGQPRQVSRNVRKDNIIRTA